MRALSGLVVVTVLGALVVAPGCGGNAIEPDGSIRPDRTGTNDARPDEGGNDGGGEPDGPGSDLRPDMAMPPDDMSPQPDEPPPPPPPPPTTIGAACTASPECGSTQNDFCLDETNFGLPGGYCSSACNPAGANTCGAGAACVNTDPNNPSAGLCVRTCSSDTDCRQGYFCVDNIFGLQPAGGGNVCAPGNPNAAPGDTCLNLLDCEPGGFCLDDASGYPGGYCTRGCDPNQADSCGQDGVCIAAGGGGVCALGCGGGGSCRQGYSCVTGFVGLTAPEPVCAPGAPNAVAVGSPCTSHAFCGAATQFCLIGNGDFCSQGCDPTAAQTGCDVGDACLFFDDQNPTNGFCFRSCSDNGDCTALNNDLSCTGRVFGQPTSNNGQVCMAGNPQAAIGDACLSVSDCPVGGFCIPEDPQSGAPLGGYCSDLCDPAANNCPGGNACIQTDPQDPDVGLCFDSCQSNNECRTGYVCTGFGPGSPTSCLPQ